MRTLFNFALLSVIAFSGVAVGQEETSQVDEVAVESTEPSNETSIVDLGPAPSDAEIDTARAEALSAATEDGIVAVTPAYIEPIDQGVIYPEYIISQDCCCQSGIIAPVAYQEPTIQGVVEGVGDIAVEGSIEPEPVADATSVVDSPATESLPVYADSSVLSEGIVTGEPVVVSEGSPMAYEGQPVIVEAESVVASAPSCGCGQGAAPASIPTEGLISSPVVSYQSAPISTSAPAANCCPPARRGFFRRLMGR